MSAITQHINILCKNCYKIQTFSPVIHRSPVYPAPQPPSQVPLTWLHWVPLTQKPHIELQSEPYVLFVHSEFFKMSRVMRKPTFCTCENKDADQLRDNREADQRLCFRYLDSTIPLLSKSEILSLYPSSVAVQPGLCWTRSETRTLFSHDLAH